MGLKDSGEFELDGEVVKNLSNSSKAGALLQTCQQCLTKARVEGTKASSS